MDEIPHICARFQAGFRLGEALHIKRGFPTPDQNCKYMWIAVTRWESGRIRSFLASEPQYNRYLRAGQTVEIAEAEIFDWLTVHADGRTEGTYTNRLLQED